MVVEIWLISEQFARISFELFLQAPRRDFAVDVQDFLESEAVVHHPNLVPEQLEMRPGRPRNAEAAREMIQPERGGPPGSQDSLLVRIHTLRLRLPVSNPDPTGHRHRV